MAPGVEFDVPGILEIPEFGKRLCGLVERSGGAIDRTFAGSTIDVGSAVVRVR
ncbi:hypothetical protein [Natrinema gelatinilyticum]|uniref:hypothetical protein n=1 Tax=Natrinema gelatinilyticum TaxID=2961571 RepID=UPI0020C3B84F|nr:hypothetical protein [Natrinema gelatinilyticum]